MAWRLVYGSKFAPSLDAGASGFLSFATKQGCSFASARRGYFSRAR